MQVTRDFAFAHFQGRFGEIFLSAALRTLEVICPIE